MRRIPGYSLWLGHVGDVRDLHSVLPAGIIAVVDLALNEPPASITRELVYCRFPLLDGPGNPPWLLGTAVEAIVSLLESNTPTLVYCGAGMSRSPAAVAAALSRITRQSPDKCLADITVSGAVDITPGLWYELSTFMTEEYLAERAKGANARAFRRVLAKAPEVEPEDQRDSI